MRHPMPYDNVPHTVALRARTSFSLDIDCVFDTGNKHRKLGEIRLFDFIFYFSRPFGP